MKHLGVTPKVLVKTQPSRMVLLSTHSPRSCVQEPGESQGADPVCFVSSCNEILSDYLFLTRFLCSHHGPLVISRTPPGWEAPLWTRAHPHAHLPAVREATGFGLPLSSPKLL